MREITRVWCASKKRHKVATVCADDEGLVLNYVAEVWHTTGSFGADCAERLRDDAVGMIYGYCKACKKPVELLVAELRAAGLAGARDMTMQFLDAIDKTHVDAGYPAMYPPGGQRHKTDPR